MAEKIQNRLMDIRAAKNVQEVHSLGFVKFNSKLKEQIHLFKIELDKGLWIFCSINHARIPMVKSDEVNWKQVSRLKILRVGK
ncbi:MULTISPECIES: hypothetical protein [Leptospira]|uniref:hypothetical protein n=1 Tax=Leptospira TaxID=171 RepID=UPI00214B3B7E|nr:hypothetical protein [Leptospira sp. id769339]MCR1795879.1 hypothetical protein [Leptospira sp. id769339]